MRQFIFNTLSDLRPYHSYMNGFLLFLGLDTCGRWFFLICLQGAGRRTPKAARNIPDSPRTYFLGADYARLTAPSSAKALWGTNRTQPAIKRHVCHCPKTRHWVRWTIYEASWTQNSDAQIRKFGPVMDM
jgi:hypothetical protein